MELGKERSSEELELRMERSSREGTKLQFLSFSFVTKEKVSRRRRDKVEQPFRNF